MEPTTGADGARPMAGRVMLVTGASRGIGAATARAFAEAGAAVVLASRDRAALEVVLRVTSLFRVRAER